MATKSKPAKSTAGKKKAPRRVRRAIQKLKLAALPKEIRPLAIKVGIAGAVGLFAASAAVAAFRNANGKLSLIGWIVAVGIPFGVQFIFKKSKLFSKNVIMGAMLAAAGFAATWNSVGAGLAANKYTGVVVKYGEKMANALPKPGQSASANGVQGIPMVRRNSVIDVKASPRGGIQGVLANRGMRSPLAA